MEGRSSFRKWSNDSSLSEAENQHHLGLGKRQQARRRSEGHAGRSPFLPDGWKIGKPDAVIPIPEHKLEATGPDEYTLITVPTNFTEDKWVTCRGTEAGQPQGGSSCACIRGRTGEAADAKKKTSDDPAVAYTKWLQVNQGTLTFIRPDAPVINDGCLKDDNGAFPGNKQTDLGSLISSYLPGREPDVYPEGTARLIKAGSKVNFQIHYSRTRQARDGRNERGTDFRKEPPKQVARRIDLSNHMFLIPAGVPGSGSDGVPHVHEGHVHHQPDAAHASARQVDDD